MHVVPTGRTRIRSMAHPVQRGGALPGTTNLGHLVFPKCRPCGNDCAPSPQPPMRGPAEQRCLQLSRPMQRHKSTVGFESKGQLKRHGSQKGAYIYKLPFLVPLIYLLVEHIEPTLWVLHAPQAIELVKCKPLQRCSGSAKLNLRAIAEILNVY